jgi:hypothetical protein
VHIYQQTNERVHYGNWVVVERDSDDLTLVLVLDSGSDYGPGFEFGSGSESDLLEQHDTSSELNGNRQGFTTHACDTAFVLCFCLCLCYCFRFRFCLCLCFCAWADNDFAATLESWVIRSPGITILRSSTPVVS